VVLAIRQLIRVCSCDSIHVYVVNMSRSSDMKDIITEFAAENITVVRIPCGWVDGQSTALSVWHVQRTARQRANTVPDATCCHHGDRWWPAAQARHIHWTTHRILHHTNHSATDFQNVIFIRHSKYGKLSNYLPVHNTKEVAICGLNQRQGEELPPQIFLTFKFLVWTKLQSNPIQSNEVWRAQVEPLCPHLQQQ